MIRVNFLALLLAVVAFGLGVGGAFAAGQASTRLATAAAAPGASTAARGAGQDVAGTAGAGTADGQAGARFAGVQGTIAEVREGSVVVRSQDGDVTVQVSPETAVRRMVVGTAADLQAGQRVAVTGQRLANGSFDARAIQLTGADEADGAPAGAGGQRRPGRP